MKTLSLIFILTLIHLPTQLSAQESSFYCEASAILQMDFFGEMEQGKLSSNINVIIEGSLFEIEQKNVTIFSLTKNKDDGKMDFTIETLNKEKNYWIKLFTKDGFGNVQTDYRGITLDDDVYCRFN